MEPYSLAVAVAWASVGGSLLQLVVQLPSVRSLAGHFRLELETTSENVRSIFRNFLPSVGARGVNQLSSYVDQILASFLPTGAVAALAYAQTIYLLPVSLFGMAVSSAELPEMSSELSSGEALASALRQRLDSALRRIAFYIVPSVVAFLALGDAISGVLFQTGKFTQDDAVYVWKVLAGATVGLLAATLGRLYTSAFWALRDTRTPLRFAMLRVVLTTALGWFLAFPVPRWLGLPAQIGLVGLTVSAGLAGWLEFTLLRRALNSRIGRTGLSFSYLARLWTAAGSAGAIAFAIKWWFPSSHPLIVGAVVLPVYGAFFFAAAFLTRIPEASRIGKTLFR
jgi:putative peptidoglycan lipid II flippase